MIDTSELTPNELRRVIVERVAPAGALGMTVEIVSFAYKFGLPPEADLVFDCRFLRNPHYDPELRERDGRSEPVARYVAQDPLYGPFLAQIEQHVMMLLPAFVREGKSYVTVALGCSGGKHRSVATAEALAASLAQAGWSPNIRHRELNAGASNAASKQTDAA